MTNPTMKSNSSGNSYSSLSKSQRILKVIDESEIELTPLEISQKLQIKHSTTRVYLRRLLRQGKVVQPYKGTYCNKITHGMIFVPLRVHNVIVTASALWLGFSDDVVEFTGAVKIRVQYGLQRKKITGRISCDAGMDQNAVLFALNRFSDVVYERTGRRLENVVLKTFEVNRDYQGVRIDGAKCYTLKGLFGVIERIYQKEEDTVRHEVKVSKPMSVDEFQSLIQGGISAYNLQQGLFMLMQEIKGLKETMKFQNEVISKQNRVLEALTQGFFKQKDNPKKHVGDSS